MGPQEAGTGAAFKKIVNVALWAGEWSAGQGGGVPAGAGLGAVLEEKRASLLQAIEECQQDRLARLSAQLQEHRSLLDGSGLVGYAQEVLKETDQPCFVQAAKQLHSRYSRAQLRGTGSPRAGASWV